MLAMSLCTDEYDSERNFRGRRITPDHVVTSIGKTPLNLVENDPKRSVNPLLHLVARLHGWGRLCAKHPICGHSPFDFAFIFLLNNS